MDLRYTKLISYLIFIEVLFFEPISGYVECDPKKNCAKTSLGDKVLNPYDCFSYYYCVEDLFGNIGPSDNALPCEADYYFNPNSHACLSGTECEYPCVVTCNTFCTDFSYERIADLDDCSTFYTCLPSGKKEKSRCPKNVPYFDGVSCTSTSYSCCTAEEKCLPYCNGKYEEVADPYDCHGYYICYASRGIALEQNRYQCQENQYFDDELGKCQAEYIPCTPICSK